MKRLGRPLLVLGAVLAAAALADAAAVASATAGRAATTDSRASAPISQATPSLPSATVVTIGRNPHGNPIPPGFVGVSLEYKTLLSAEPPAVTGRQPGTGAADPQSGPRADADRPDRRR